MPNKVLIYRKKKSEFNSIENVFDTLLPFLNIKKIELPFFSIGIMNRIKNIFFIQKKHKQLNHITGHDHYILIGLKKNTNILTIHDIEILKRTKGLKRYLLKKIWFDWPIKKSFVVTTISEFTKRELLKLNNYKTPIIVIPNPLTLALKYSPKPFNIECPTILHIGVKANKNLPRLIQALNGINCKLNIIGKEDQTIIKFLKQNKISFTFKSNLSNTQMIEEYKNCDLVSFVSTYEGFGLPIIEAQALGRVVLTSNISSMPEVSGNGAFFVNPFSEEDIKKGILELINNTPLRESLIIKGIENVKRFDPQKIANQYNNLYTQVLSS